MPKEGDRVELISTTDAYNSVHPGDRGSVSLVDSAGTIHVTWDSGATLGLIPGEDVWREVAK